MYSSVPHWQGRVGMTYEVAKDRRLATVQPARLSTALCPGSTWPEDIIPVLRVLSSCVTVSTDFYFIDISVIDYLRRHDYLFTL